eukprot:5859000-Pleurochrysis_carterae.AAC.1
MCVGPPRVRPSAAVHRARGDASTCAQDGGAARGGERPDGAAAVCGRLLRRREPRLVAAAPRN